MKLTKIQYRQGRKKRIRMRVSGTSARPRLAVYRSLKAVSAQLIDDSAHRTIASASTREVKAAGNIEGARKAGVLLAKKAKEAGVTAVVFDRNGYKYHGSIKALAESAREGGLQF